MKRALPVIAIAAVSIGLAVAAHAQGSLMDMGKTLLQNEVQQRLPQAGGTTTSSSTGGLGNSLDAGQIGSGLKEALKVAADHVTSNLGRPDGFNANPAIHIPLPQNLQLVQKGLAMAGQSAMVDDLETQLNRAAEAATPKAKQIFTDSLQRMSLDDARGILNGPQDAATQYFKRTMSPDLKTAMRPMVDKTVAQSGAVQSFQTVTAAAQTLPMVGGAVSGGPSMLTDHVLDYALAGIFKYLGEEEASIRSDPAKRTTDLLKKVFGG
jgi:hypothetical protein